MFLIEQIFFAFELELFKSLTIKSL